VLEEFLEEPLTFIAETITGAFATGTKGVTVAGGRIVQGILKGQVFKQFYREFKHLREAGRIPDDFAEKKYGFQTWVELMTIIDEESPDADRLEALKAMFFAVNKVGTTDGERIAAYQLWHIAKRLTSGEVLLLKVVYEGRGTYVGTLGANAQSYRFWAEHIAKSAGHNIVGLVSLHEKKLTELGLFSERNYPDGSGINPENARLTDLGLRFQKNLENYSLEMRDMG
jgi:hypothetical protein